jgi:hypothetical protein
LQARIATRHPANPKTCDPQYVEKLELEFRQGPGGKIVAEWYWPAGLIVDGDKALSLVRYGLAEPIDQECAEACGMSADAVRVAIENQKMAQAGVHSKEDQELYRAGVIRGFQPDGKGGLKPIDGPNAEKYRAALAAKMSQENESDE